MTTHPAYDLHGEHPADRVMHTHAITSDRTLRGAPAPTPRQVAAVMHALADFTHNQHMVSATVADLGKDRADLGPDWQHAMGLGRYFHALGDWLERDAACAYCHDDPSRSHICPRCGRPATDLTATPDAQTKD